MQISEKQAEAKKCFAEAKELLVKPEITGEDEQQIEKLIETGKKLMAQVAQLKEVTKYAAVVVEQKQQELGQLEEKQPGSFKTFGHYLVANAQAGNIRYRGPLDSRLALWSDKSEPQGDPMRTSVLGTQVKGGFAQKATMVENIGARGGFLVPQEFIPELYGVLAEQTIVRQRATIIPMSRRQVLIPVIDQTGTTAGQAHWYGGMIAKWTEEATEKTQTDPTFRQATLTAHKLVLFTKSSDELLEDEAVGLSAFLMGPMGFTGAITWQEEYTFLNGTGVGQPQGVIGAGCTISIARAATGAVSFGDLADMLEAFLATGGRGIWHMTQSLMSEMIQLAGPSTTYGSYIWTPNARDGIPGSVLGYPVVWTEKLPLKGTAGDVLLANWPFYLIGDRKRTTIESSNIPSFQDDVTSWRCVHRVDGRPWLSAALTLQDGITQISPFVILGDKET